MQFMLFLGINCIYSFYLLTSKKTIFSLQHPNYKISLVFLLF